MQTFLLEVRVVCIGQKMESWAVKRGVDSVSLTLLEMRLAEEVGKPKDEDIHLSKFKLGVKRIAN
ncbi:unnamed protein product [Prunus armeniaca]